HLFITLSSKIQNPLDSFITPVPTTDFTTFFTRSSHTHQIQENNNHATFELFPMLPQELQDKVWHFALEEAHRDKGLQVLCHAGCEVPVLPDESSRSSERLESPVFNGSMNKKFGLRNLKNLILSCKDAKDYLQHPSAQAATSLKFPKQGFYSVLYELDEVLIECSAPQYEYLTVPDPRVFVPSGLHLLRHIHLVIRQHDLATFMLQSSILRAAAERSGAFPSFRRLVLGPLGDTPPAGRTYKFSTDVLQAELLPEEVNVTERWTAGERRQWLREIREFMGEVAWNKDIGGPAAWSSADLPGQCY
ncbi:hypothetical protein GE09DRAFT_1267391, partial [Coniochaeta sp. 2T2.1]